MLPDFPQHPAAPTRCVLRGLTLGPALLEKTRATANLESAEGQARTAALVSLVLDVVGKGPHLKDTGTQPRGPTTSP